MTNEPITWRPNKWVLLRYTIHNGDTLERVLVNFNSRYDTKDSWRLSETLQSKRKQGNDIYFRTYDKEIYVCRPQDQGMTELMESRMPEIRYNASIILGASVEIVDYTGEKNG